jgi:HEAT repeat protein
MSSSLDQFRAILDHLDEEQRAHRLLFFRALHDAGADALQELGPRLQRVSTTRSFRQLVYEGSFYYPWPGWVPLLERAIRRESDPELFAVGVAALGHIGDSEALAALKALSLLSLSPGFQERIAEALAEADPTQAWDHHLGLLLKGSENPAVANEAARQLEQLLGASKLDSLKPLLSHPDLLIFRHAVKLVAKVPSTEAASLLAEFVEACHREALEDRHLKQLAGALRGLDREAARDMIFSKLSEDLKEREGTTLEGLLTQSGNQAVATAEGLRERAAGHMDRFLLEALAAHLESKPVRLLALFGEVAEEMNLRARRQAFVMEAGADGLARMAKTGLLPEAEALRILEDALSLQTGREGVARALAGLAAADNAALMDRLIRHPDNGSRAAAVEVLGERKEEALRPILLAACRDPISDIAQRAMIHLGNLPGLEPVARELLRSGRLEDIKLGIRFVGLHRLAGLASELLDLVQNSTREELALEALEALGNAGSMEVAPALVELLHSGQSPRMQIALAQALRDMGHAGVAEVLCSKAEELKSPILHAVALEALARAEVSVAPLILAQMLGAWEGRNPWANRFRAIQALPRIQSQDRKLWQELHALVQGGIAEAKASGSWGATELGKIQTVAREISKRVSGP